MKRVIIKTTPSYDRTYLALPRSDRSLVRGVLELFEYDPYNPALNHHALHGSMLGKHALFVDHDLRIVFRVKGDYEEILLVDVGSHKEVYAH